MRQTIVYLIRHAKQLKEFESIINVYDDSQIRNEKIILIVDGEKETDKMSKIGELKNIDIIWSSNYVRAISTVVKYSL